MSNSGGRHTLTKSRFEAFSDGVFAIAITLLILEIHIPATPANPTLADQARALLEIWPNYLVYAVSFATIGIMWMNHDALMRNVRRVTHGMVLANLFLLAWICFVSFATEVFVRFGFTGVAVAYYGCTLVGCSIGYNLLLHQVHIAHAARAPRTLWGLLGFTAYPAATIVGYFFPVVGIVVYALMALFYMLPANQGSVILRLEEA